MEMTVAVGGVANISSMPAEYKKEQILGFFLYDPEGKGERVTGFMMKGTNAERVCNAATAATTAAASPRPLFVARGIAYHIPLGVPRAAFFVETIEKVEAPGRRPTRGPRAATGSSARLDGRQRHEGEAVPGSLPGAGEDARAATRSM
jgi:hypothetical protein